MADTPDYDDIESTIMTNDPEGLTITDSGAGDTALLLSDINLRLERMERTVEGLREGVNTIGVMMNNVAQAFDQIMQKVQSGGIGSLLGGFMGGKNNG